MAKRGRPRGFNINPPAVLDLLERKDDTKQALAAAGGVTPSHLADALHGEKGINLRAIQGMAEFLECRPETIAPELAGFVFLRQADPSPAAVPA